MAESSTLAASAASTSSTAIEALIEARPPATDQFTYLTLIQENLSPDVLPTLHEILQDVQLTQEIGWDLVETLVPLLPGSESCLDDVARLGNPREVILKVLEVLEGLKTTRLCGPSKGEDKRGGGGGEEDEDEEEELANVEEGKEEDPQTAEMTTRTFVVLLGMLSVLHRRIKTKYPSRFLETTLRTILAAYRPDQLAMTTAVLGLVRSLSANKRPLPPLRRSQPHLMTLDLAAGGSESSKESKGTSTDASTSISGALVRQISAIGQVASNTDQTDESAVSIPDPEAEDLVDPAEGAVQQRLLQSFLTCILEAYVNANEMAWAPRLFEHYHPNKIVPGRPTALQRFREDPDLAARDSTVGKLVALALDLGLKYSDAFVHSVSNGPVRRNPLAAIDIAATGTGGRPVAPEMHIFPDHYAILKAYLEDGAASEVGRSPGTVEAIVTFGMWLEHSGLYFESPASAEAPVPTPYMPYHHLLTLCSMLHPSLPVRNAATSLAGAVLHADPDPEDRLKILQDLLENCMFASLKACAVTWLREEIIAAGNGTGARAQKATAAATSTPFGSTEAVEQLQYAIFPDLQALHQNVTASTPENDARAVLLEYWIQNSPFLLQAANFAYFLFQSERFRATVVPPGMGPAIGQRYVEPLVQAAMRLRRELDDGGGKVAETAETAELEHISMDLEVLASRLQSLELS
ncbi:yap-binding protein-like protein [Grosmannia clavigera kw1407]|uniref:Yap-binding protein-like protein n=1 Tax=Grosmannia clavigera (strain kw1407 / UAMH 11150) TaxID=655863 RepID=F0XAG5_GROCL|nr:yap-binding protein-like protein [Grosmannia clavigera kw1407]EFX05212.1 yap-binding protein-like protein [Grosmannia clavigera kw1407]